jgi:hypothetical protein
MKMGDKAGLRDHERGSDRQGRTKDRTKRASTSSWLGYIHVDDVDKRRWLR